MILEVNSTVPDLQLNNSGNNLPEKKECAAMKQLFNLSGGDVLQLSKDTTEIEFLVDVPNNPTATDGEKATIDYQLNGASQQAVESRVKGLEVSWTIKAPLDRSVLDYEIVLEQSPVPVVVGKLEIEPHVAVIHNATVALPTEPVIKTTPPTQPPIPKKDLGWLGNNLGKVMGCGVALFVVVGFMGCITSVCLMIFGMTNIPNKTESAPVSIPTPAPEKPKPEETPAPTAKVESFPDTTQQKREKFCKMCRKLVGIRPSSCESCPK